MRNVKEPTHYSKRVGHEVPGVVPVLSEWVLCHVYRAFEYKYKKKMRYINAMYHKLRETAYCDGDNTMQLNNEPSICIRKDICAHGKKNLLFLPFNMATVQNLYCMIVHTDS